MRRKHKVLVEITFEVPVTGKLAKDVVEDLVRAGSDLEKQFNEPHRPHPDITKIHAKDFARVAASAQFRTS